MAFYKSWLILGYWSYYGSIFKLIVSIYFSFQNKVLSSSGSDGNLLKIMFKFELDFRSSSDPKLDKNAYKRTHYKRTPAFFDV